MQRCMEQKNLKGKPQDVVQRELAACAQAWEQVADQKAQAPVEDIDEEALAEQFIED